MFLFMNMILAFAYVFWLSHSVFVMNFCLLVFPNPLSATIQLYCYVSVYRFDFFSTYVYVYWFFEYGHVPWSYESFRRMILKLVMFSGWAFCHVLQYTTFHGMLSFFVLCHVPSRVWGSESCKRLVLCFTPHVLHILLCPSSQLCYRFSIYVTVLRISHVSRYKSNIRFGYLYSNQNFVSVNYVLEYLLSHPYDLLYIFSWFQEVFQTALEKTGTSSSH